MRRLSFCFGEQIHLWRQKISRATVPAVQRDPESCRPFNEPSRRTEAVNLAWDWFHALKIERPAEEWRIVGVLRKPYAQWDIYLRSGGHCTIVTVNTCSGQLVQAICTRLPDPKMAWVPLKLRLAS